MSDAVRAQSRYQFLIHILVGSVPAAVRRAVLQKSNVGLYPFVGWINLVRRGIAVAVAEWICMIARYWICGLGGKQHVRLEQQYTLLPVVLTVHLRLLSPLKSRVSREYTLCMYRRSACLSDLPWFPL